MTTVSHLVLDEKCKAGEFCEIINTLTDFDEITIKNHAIDDIYKPELLKLLSTKNLHISNKFVEEKIKRGI